MHSGSGVVQRVMALVLCLLLSPLPMLAQQGATSPQAGQITTLVPHATRNFEIAAAKQDVRWNDLMQTARSGRMRMSLRDGSILSMGSETQVRVVQHDPMAQQTQLQLNYGRLRSRVVSLTKPNSRFEVQTPVAIASVVGTDFYVAATESTATVMCYSGTVVVKLPNAAQRVTLNAGQMVEVQRGSIGAVQPTPPAVQQDSIDQTTTEGYAVADENRGTRNMIISIGAAAIGAMIGVVASRQGGSSATTGAAGSTAGSTDKPK
jgi:hypothetical protein